MVAARAAGLPLEHALGVARFHGLDLAIADGVFVPRLRAAPLVDAVVRALPVGGTVVDLGCGCGAIAAAVASARPDAEVHAAEIDPAAVEFARVNGRRYGFHVHQGDWAAALPAPLRGRIDVAVAYFPHVPSDAVRFIPGDFRAHEPRRTVDGGTDGLDALRAAAASIAPWLRPGAPLITLLSAEQAGQVPGVVADTSPDPADLDDADDLDDVIVHLALPPCPIQDRVP